MRPFVHQAPATRVVFGAGSLTHLERELGLLGLRRVLVLSTPGQSAAAHALCERLGPLCTGVFDRAVMHVPLGVAIEGVEAARSQRADGTVALGGGSTIGLAKAIALETGLPIVAVPTTYAGSEMTPIHGITDGGIKRTGRDARVLPRTVIYDPELSRDLPVGISVTSGMNAMAHAVEALYASDSTPMTDLMAEEGLRALSGALPVLRQRPRDETARSDALYGAWLCGAVLGQVAMALHHKLCHVLGGSFNLPHAEVHTVVLPQATAFNADAAPQAMARVARALGCSHAAQGLFDLARDNGAPVSLRSLGMAQADLDRAADLAAAQPYANPRPVGPAQRDALRELLQRAWDGTRPD